MAMVKPSWPINAREPQTEGGGFLFIRCFSSVFSRYYTMRIIAHGSAYLQQLIQSGVSVTCARDQGGAKGGVPSPYPIRHGGVVACRVRAGHPALGPCPG